MNKKIKVVILVLFLLIIVSIKFDVFNSNKKVDESYKDDFYEAVNKKTIEELENEKDEPYYGVFSSQTQDLVNEKIDVIIDEFIKENKDAEKLSKLILNENEDISLLNKYIEKIESSKNIDEYLKNVFQANKDLTMNMIINPGISENVRNNKENVILFQPISLDFGMSNSDYYNNPLYSAYEAIFIKYDRKILEYCGYSADEAKKEIKKLNKFYIEIAKNTKSVKEMSEISNLYNVISKDDLKKVYSNIDIENYLNLMGLPTDYAYNIVDKEQAEYVNGLLKNENLDVLKLYAKLNILQTYGDFGSKKIKDIFEEMNSELSGKKELEKTEEEKLKKEKDIIRSYIMAYYLEEIEKRYFEKYVDSESVSALEGIVDDIISQYKIKLNNNDWLSNETKNKAIEKLEAITINVAEPNYIFNYYDKYEMKEDILSTVISLNSVVRKYSIENAKNQKFPAAVNQLTVNAYYQPIDNSINFPAALLEYGIKDNYYENLGSFGMVIAHEITHAFDNNGAKFDKDGNLNDWWQEEDYKKFEEKAEAIIKYYNQYKVNKRFVNGELTVSENIADLGSVSCLIEIAENKNATEKDYKTLYTSFAKLWASKITPEIQKILMINDVHSPDKVRVNAVLSSMDNFYEIYDIDEKCGLYKENKVKLW